MGHFTETATKLASFIIFLAMRIGNYIIKKRQIDDRGQRDHLVSCDKRERS